MKKNELKKVIKEIVRESLMEIFAEMKLESIVENVVRKNVEFSKPVSTRSMAEVLSPEVSQPSRQELSPERKLIMEKIGVDDSAWNTVYADTIDSDNSIITGEEKPELVSEGTLRQAGLLKDYSKFV